MHLTCDLIDEVAPALGLVVLQVDQRIESDFRRMLPSGVTLHVTRVPSGRDVTPDTLQQMEADIPGAVGLLPPAARFRAIGYACTSGAAQIGSARVAELVHGAAAVDAVTDPLMALLAACKTLGIDRLALVSPYIASVSGQLRKALAAEGIETAAFGSFDVAEEARVARISKESLRAAARQLAAQRGVDGLFMSCTNLDTLDIIAPLEAELGIPVLSSNQVLAWHFCQLASLDPVAAAPGILFCAGNPSGTFTLSGSDIEA